MSVCLCLSVCLSVYLSVCLSVCLCLSQSLGDSCYVTVVVVTLHHVPVMHRPQFIDYETLISRRDGSAALVHQSQQDRRDVNR